MAWEACNDVSALRQHKASCTGKVFSKTIFQDHFPQTTLMLTVEAGQCWRRRHKQLHADQRVTVDDTLPSS